MTRVIVHNHLPARDAEATMTQYSASGKLVRKAPYSGTLHSIWSQQIPYGRIEISTPTGAFVRRSHEEESTPQRDSSPEMQAFLARQAARRAVAQEGVTRADALLRRVVAAKKVLKGRGESPFNGRAANARDYVITMRAQYGLAGLAVTQGNVNAHNEWLEKARKAESEANEAVNATERQAGESR
jgi:hypothetical protein